MEKVKKFFSRAIITQESTLPQSEAKTNFRNFSGDRPCPRCGSTTTRTGAGRRPQEASLHCSECKRFVRWVSAGELKAFSGNSSENQQPVAVIFFVPQPQTEQMLLDLIGQKEVSHV